MQAKVEVEMKCFVAVKDEGEAHFLRSGTVFGT